MDDDSVIDVLNRLIAICRDGASVYRSAAESLADLQSQALLMDMADKRSLSATALADLVSSRGAEPACCRHPRVAAEPVAISCDRAALVERLRQTGGAGARRVQQGPGSGSADRSPCPCRSTLSSDPPSVRQAGDAAERPGGPRA